MPSLASKSTGLQRSCARLAAVFLLSVILSGCLVDAASSKPKKPKHPAKGKGVGGTGCPPFAAYDALMKHETTSVFGEFLLFLKYQKFESFLRSISVNSALAVPHNHEFMKLFVALKLHIQANGEKNFKSMEWELTREQRSKVEGELRKLVIDIPTFRKALGLDESRKCNLIAVLNDITKGIDGVSQGTHSSLENKFSASKKTIPPTRRRLMGTCVTPPTAQDFVPVGSGYDSYKGNPAPTTSAGTDPGLFKADVFVVSSSDGSEDQAWCYTAVSECSTLTTVESSSSATETQQSMTASCGINGAYEEDSFSANADFSETANSASSSTAFTCISGGVYREGEFVFTPTDTTANFTSNFLNVLNTIGTAISTATTTDNNTDLALNSLYTDYGTHWVYQMYIGGIGQMTMQMSSASYASLNSEGVDVSGSAEASYGLSSGSIDASYAGSDATATQEACQTGTYTSSQAPAEVDPTFPSSTSSSTTGPSFDCGTWSTAILNGGEFGYPQFTVQDYGTMLRTAWLYGKLGSLGWSQAFTDTVANSIDAYMTSCGPGGCDPVVEGCNNGYYGNPDVAPCASCYGDVATGTNLPGDCSWGNPCNNVTGVCKYIPGLWSNLWSYNFFTDSDTGAIMPAFTVNGFNGVQGCCDGGYGLSGKYNDTPTSFNDWHSTLGDEDGGTWQHTGYFIPPTTGSYKFSMTCDDSGYFWIDAPATDGGALVAFYATSNYAHLISSKLSTAYSATALQLTAGTAYPVRFQWANKRTESTQWSITFKYSLNGAGYVIAGTTGCGSFYYNPATVACAPDTGILGPNGGPNVFWTNPGASDNSRKVANCAYVGY